jgi:hypothetical protein
LRFTSEGLLLTASPHPIVTFQGQAEGEPRARENRGVSESIDGDADDKRGEMTAAKSLGSQAMPSRLGNLQNGVLLS